VTGGGDRFVGAGRTGGGEVRATADMLRSEAQAALLLGGEDRGRRDDRTAVLARGRGRAPSTVGCHEIRADGSDGRRHRRGDSAG